jgi:hypothetical protein
MKPRTGPSTLVLLTTFAASLTTASPANADLIFNVRTQGTLTQTGVPPVIHVDVNHIVTSSTPFALSTAGTLPRLRLILEAVVEDLQLARRPAHGPLQQRGDLALQHGVGLDPDGIPEGFLLQQAQQLRAGERRVAPEELGDVEIPVACDDRQQHAPPVLGAGAVAPPEHDPLQVAELVEQEQRVVARTAEVAVVGAALLTAVGLADGAVHVEDQLGELTVRMGLVDPLARQIDQERQILVGAECVGLEAGHLTGGRGCGVLGPATHDGPHHGIEAKAIGVIDILVTGQSAVN